MHWRIRASGRSSHRDLAAVADALPHERDTPSMLRPVGRAARLDYSLLRGTLIRSPRRSPARPTRSQRFQSVRRGAPRVTSRGHSKLGPALRGHWRTLAQTTSISPDLVGGRDHEPLDPGANQARKPLQGARECEEHAAIRVPCIHVPLELASAKAASRPRDVIHEVAEATV